jgi:hypothetical protein
VRLHVVLRLEARPKTPFLREMSKGHSPLNPFLWGLCGFWCRAPGFRFRVPGSRCQVPGSRLRVPGARCRVPGAGLQAPVPGSRCRVPGSRLRVPGYRLRVPGSRCRPPGAGFQAPGAGFQVQASPGAGFQVTSARRQRQGPMFHWGYSPEKPPKGAEPRCQRATEWRQHLAWGEAQAKPSKAPGQASQENRALKERHHDFESLIRSACAALTGLGIVGGTTWGSALASPCAPPQARLCRRSAARWHLFGECPTMLGVARHPSR